MSKQKAVLVTGCAGFIGSNFTAQFAKKYPNVTIVGIDNFATGRREAVTPTVVLCEGSIIDTAFLDNVFKKYHPEYIFHFAALPRVSFSLEQPTKTTDANVVGTVALLEKARDYKVKRLIFSSSSSVYGGAKYLPTNEKDNPPRPISPYALQKFQGEQFCRMFSNLFKVDTVCLRYFNVFGPGQYGDSAYSTVISAWLENLYFPKLKLFLEGDGRQSRDFCYVDNVVQANIKAMLAKEPLKGLAMNVAHGERTTLLEVKDLIEKYTGKKLELEKRPPRLGDVRHTHANISLAKKKLGYSPTVNFAQGMSRAVEWFKGRTK